MQKKEIIQFTNIPSFLNSQKVENALVEFSSLYGFSIDKLSYNFVSKETLLEMNRQYLKHDTHTDIISFDYTSDKSLTAEFFISMWAVAQSAEEEAQSTENETLRVISHGILHCMGKNDKNKAEQMEMRRLEEEFITLFHVKHKNHV